MKVVRLRRGSRKSEQRLENALESTKSSQKKERVPLIIKDGSQSVIHGPSGLESGHLSPARLNIRFSLRLKSFFHFCAVGRFVFVFIIALCQGRKITVAQDRHGIETNRSI